MHVTISMTVHNSKDDNTFLPYKFYSTFTINFYTY